MSDGRSVFWFGLGLALLVGLLQLGSHALKDRPSVPEPTVSAEPTALPSAAASADQGCPAGLDLPSGVSAQVCLPVGNDDLTSLKPSDNPYGEGEITAFRSPSGSIACADIRDRTVACAVTGRTFKVEGAPQGQTVVVSAGRPLPQSDIRAPAAAVDDPAKFAIPKLQFGQVVRMNAEWFCGVEEVGVACWSAREHSGLLVSRTQSVTWGPDGVDRAA